MPPDARRREAISILRKQDPALADEIEELLEEAPVERLLRSALDKQSAAVEGAFERLAVEISSFRKQTMLTFIFALVLQSALVLGSLSLQLPGLTLSTSGAP